MVQPNKNPGPVVQPRENRNLRFHIFTRVLENLTKSKIWRFSGLVSLPGPFACRRLQVMQLILVR